MHNRHLECVVPENIHTPHGGSRNFLGVGGSKRDKFPKGRGVHKEFFFQEGLKCDRINTYVFFPIDSGNQEKRKVLSVEIDVGFLVYYYSGTRRHIQHWGTPKYHIRRWVKQNGWQEKYRSQSPNIGRKAIVLITNVSRRGPAIWQRWRFGVHFIF